MYYNQNDYPHIPYPSPALPKATVKSGGCGVVTMAMALEDLTGDKHPPEQMAAYAMGKGARVTGGTDLVRLCKAVAGEYGLLYSTASKAADALAALNRGAAVISNVGGDRTGYTGLFSTGGHYIYLRAADGATVTVWDSGYYKGKFDRTGRRGKVRVALPDLYTDMADIDRDCAGRNPRYYILEDDMTQEKFNQMLNEALKQRDKLPASDWARAELEQAKGAGVTDGTRPQSLVTRQEAAIMAARAKGHK